MLAPFILMRLEKKSSCKVNFLLNILGKRPDGFHELETVIHPVNLYDHLSFEKIPSGLELTCNRPELPTDSTNLVHRAASSFLESARISEGVKVHLEKHIPLAAGLGGGSGNAAATLEGLNDLFDHPLDPPEIHRLAAQLGSDVPFFLQPCPALATGRGEHVISLEVFPALAGAAFLLIYPGFGISTAWSYQQLSRFPTALNGTVGRAQELITLLQTSDLTTAGRAFCNSLEPAALEKYPLLQLYQEFLRDLGARVTLMSGSGSTTFAIFGSAHEAKKAVGKIEGRFGPVWTAVVPV